MGPSCRKLMTYLNIAPNKSAMKNPLSQDRNACVFCDVHHALKLLWNHLLDEGYELHKINQNADCRRRPAVSHKLTNVT